MISTFALSVIFIDCLYWLIKLGAYNLIKSIFTIWAAVKVLNLNIPTLTLGKLLTPSLSYLQLPNRNSKSLQLSHLRPNRICRTLKIFLPQEIRILIRVHQSATLVDRNI